MASTSQAVRIYPDPIRELAFGSITTSYVAVGTALENPARLVLFQNTSNQPLYVSWDGSTNHLYLVAGSFILLDIGTNKGLGSEFCISEKTTFYTKYSGSAPASGGCVISVFYGRQ